jgi:hypothetical protein
MTSDHAIDASRFVDVDMSGIDPPKIVLRVSHDLYPTVAQAEALHAVCDSPQAVFDAKVVEVMPADVGAYYMTLPLAMRQGFRVAARKQ